MFLNIGGWIFSLNYIFWGDFFKGKKSWDDLRKNKGEMDVKLVKII